jgi:hypothetical protein
MYTEIKNTDATEYNMYDINKMVLSLKKIFNFFYKHHQINTNKVCLTLVLIILFYIFSMNKP